MFGIDELKELGELGAGALLGIAFILFLLYLLRRDKHDSEAEEAEVKQHQKEIDDRATQRQQEIEERKLYLDMVRNLIDAQMTMTDILTGIRDDYKAGKQQMIEVTARRDTEIKAGFQSLQTSVEAVPSRVGEITEPQINTIRETLAVLLGELEMRVCKRIDEAIGRNSDVVLPLIQAEIQALSAQIIERVDKITDVPGEVARLMKSQHEDSAPQTAEPHEQPADSALAIEGEPPKG